MSGAGNQEPGRIILRPGETRLLADPGRAWVVREGMAEVFAAPEEGGLAVGRRRRLLNAGAGSLLLGLPGPEAHPAPRVFVLATRALRLLELPLDALHARLAAEGRDPRTALESWASAIGEALAVPPAPAAAEPWTPGASHRLAPGEARRAPRAGLIWLRVVEGEARLLGREDLTIAAPSPALPLGAGMWLATGGAVRIECRIAPASEAEALAGVERLRTLLARQLLTLEAERRAQAETRRRRRALLQRRDARQALHEVASLLVPGPPLPAGADSPLETAMTRAGQALGVTIRMPATGPPRGPQRQALAAICRASRLRWRLVSLRGRWWRRDAGCLIGLLDGERRPVTLVQEPGQPYQLYDPASETETRVEAALASRLAPEAYLLYRPVPEGITRPRQLLGLSLRGRGGDLFLVLALAVTATLAGMLMPVATGVVMDTAIPDADRALLLELGLGLIGAALGVALLGLAQGILAIRLGISTDVTLQAAIWDRLLRLRPAFFRRFVSGDLLMRARVVGEINRTLNGAVLHSILTGAVSVLNLGLLLYYSAPLALFAVLLALLVGAASLGAGWVVRRHEWALIESEGPLFGLLVQLVGAVAKLRVAGAERRAFGVWLHRHLEQLRHTYSAQRARDYLTVLNQGLPVVAVMLLFWLGAGRLGGKGLTVGEFLAFNATLGIFMAGVTMLSNALVDVLDVVLQARRLRPLLEARPEVDEVRADPGELQGAVAVEHVDFRYQPGGPKVLSDITIQAAPGELVALVGPSGGGKSTVLRLLLGFDVPESGTVRLDGQDLAGLDIVLVRRRLGVVLQDGRIWAGSLLDNLSAGTGIGHEEAWMALEDAGLGGDVRAMPMGLHTVVSEGGTNLSGGQRQRLRIARALVGRPRILLFDEATSALDNETQALVSRRLAQRRVTRIVIAHRLSTVRDADRIYVLDRGRVVEQGGYAELAGGGGLFASLLQRQQA